MDYQTLPSADLVRDCSGHTVGIPAADSTVQNLEKHLRVQTEPADETSPLQSDVVRCVFKLWVYANQMSSLHRTHVDRINNLLKLVILKVLKKVCNYLKRWQFVVYIKM